MELERNPMKYAVAGIRTAAERYDLEDLPVLAIGYSRGGALAVEYGATAAGEDGVPVPDAIMSVFPGSFGNFDRRIYLVPLEDDTIVLLMFGDRDNVVRDPGFRMLLDRPRGEPVPGRPGPLPVRALERGLRRRPLRPASVHAGAKAAFWKPADKLLAGLEEDAD